MHTRIANEHDVCVCTSRNACDDDVAEMFFDDQGNLTPKKNNRPRILFSPAQGDHVLLYKGRPVWLSRRKQEGVSDKSFSTGQMLPEEYDIWILGRQQALVRQLIQDAMDLALPVDIIETVVFMSIESGWRQIMRRKPRPINSVILEPGILERILFDARGFLNSKDWYEGLGIPYRRGYLLEGVPGSGKTSAILAIAGALEMNLFMLSLGTRGMDDDKLNNLLSQIPPRSVVLLEDVDATFVGRDMNKAAEGISAVTFSGLLNALDGAAAREGRILFMTTNHVDKLDPALIRPGRADMRVHFGYAMQQQAEQMFLRFFPGHELLARQFGNLTEENCIPMARIQEYLLLYRNDIDGASVNWTAAQIGAKHFAEAALTAVPAIKDHETDLIKAESAPEVAA